MQIQGSGLGNWSNTAIVTGSGALLVSQVNASGTVGAFPDKTDTNIANEFQNQILNNIETQMRIMNSHLEKLTDQVIKKEDLEVE